MPSKDNEPAVDPRVTKRRVTMRSTALAPDPDEKGNPVFRTFEAVDFVRPDFLDAYVAEARTRWQQVTVSDEPDAGPGGYHGETHVPARLTSHPLAGQTFAATPENERD